MSLRREWAGRLFCRLVPAELGDETGYYLGVVAPITGERQDVRVRHCRRWVSSIRQRARLHMLRHVMPWIVAPLALLLLTGHVLKWDRVRVDGTTLALLGILLIAPYIPLIRKIRVSEFEAEIDRGEIERVRERVADDLPPVPLEPTKTSSDEPPILLQVRQDPPLGLVKLRIELERLLRALSRRVGLSDTRMPYSLGRMTTELGKRDVLPPGVVGALRDVIPLLNRAAHGEYIRTEDAEELALLGIRLLEEIRSIYEESLGIPPES